MIIYIKNAFFLKLRENGKFYRKVLRRTAASLPEILSFTANFRVENLFTELLKKLPTSREVGSFKINAFLMNQDRLFN